MANQQRVFDFIEATPEVTGRAYPLFPAIQVGHYKMSVQASDFHYCQPKVSGLGLRNYDSYEVAIWHSDTPGMNWISQELYNKLGLYPDHDDVVGRVSPEDVQVAFERLNEIGQMEVEKGEASQVS